MTGSGPPTLRRGWLERDAWRGTRAGLWAWLLQRAAALALVVAVALHLRNPFVRPVRAALLGLVLLHGLLGVRSILLDVGVPVRLHRALLVAALAAGVLLFLLAWSRRWF